MKAVGSRITWPKHWNSSTIHLEDLDFETSWKPIRYVRRWRLIASGSSVTDQEEGERAASFTAVSCMFDHIQLHICTYFSSFWFWRWCAGQGGVSGGVFLLELFQIQWVAQGHLSRTSEVIGDQSKCQLQGSLSNTPSPCFYLATAVGTFRGVMTLSLSYSDNSWPWEKKDFYCTNTSIQSIYSIQWDGGSLMEKINSIPQKYRPSPPTWSIRHWCRCITQLDTGYRRSFVLLL